MLFVLLRIVLSYDYISNMADAYKRKKLISLREHLGSPPGFLVGSVLLIFLVLCVVLYVCGFFLYFYLSSSSVLCDQCCGCLWIAPLIFS